MKSRLCLCNGTILKKDLTRFAPLPLATGLLLWVIGAMLRATNTRLDPQYRPEPVMIAMYVFMFLGTASAFYLFGYLTKKKECDAIHALPVRRDTLLLTKILAGFLQFALPCFLFYIFLPGNRGWAFQIAVSTCVWLFSFGLAALAMMLVGRPVAGFILFLLMHDLPTTLYTVVENLYLPQLPGVYMGWNSAKLSGLNYITSLDYTEGTLSEIFLPLGGFALAGVAFLALTWIAYRRRKLERAGDFLAFKWLEPVLAWSLGISIAIVTMEICYIVEASIWLGLIIGLTVGYFAAMMFFARSVKVFGKRNLAGWGALVAFMAASLYVTSLDPLGLVERVPEADRIESVSLCDNTYGYMNVDYFATFTNVYTTSDPGEIEQLRQIHRNMILLGEQELDAEQAYSNQFYLVYQLKDGSQLIRTYYVLRGEELKQVKYFLSQPESLVGSADLEDLLDRMGEISAFGVNGGTVHTQRAFLEVFLEECEAGWMYTPDYDGLSSWSVDFVLDPGTPDAAGYTVDIPLTAQKTIAWLENYFSNQN